MLTYAYKIQAKTSTLTAPFKGVLSRAPGHIFAYLLHSNFSTPIDFKQKCKQQLAKAIKDTQGRLKSAQAHCKHNFDKRHRKNDEEIKAGDQVDLRVKGKTKKLRGIS